MVAGVVLYNKCMYGYKTPAADYLGITDEAFSINGKVQGYLGGAPNKMVWNRGPCMK